MSKQKQKTRKYILISIWVVILVLIIGNTSKMLILKKTGIQTYGMVTSMQKVGSKGKYSCHYNYWIDGKTFSGRIIFDQLSQGDTIDVLYLPGFPKISVPQKFIDEYY